MSDADGGRIEQYLDRHPDASVAQVGGRFGLTVNESVRRIGSVDENPTSEAAEEESPEHQNPIDIDDVTDAERAAMLADYIDRLEAEFGTRPKLMPLDTDGKGPIITGRCSLDSAEADRLLVDADEAIRRIRVESARGFAIYAGRSDHHTERIVFVDHDDTDEFPAPVADPTLEVLSGSGRGTHETGRNDPDDPVANARVGDNFGEVRAENWFVVTPGSIHPSGGIYHVCEDRPIETLSDADLSERERPATATRRETPRRTSPTDADGKGGRPADETIAERLDTAFEHSPNGSKYRNIYDGKYAAAGYNDRSSAEYALACWLDMWVGFGNRIIVRQLMDRSNAEKWAERPDESYRGSVLAGVGRQEWYADEGPNDEPMGDPVSTLPLTQLDALDTGERRRAARKRDLSWPTTDELRDGIRNRLIEAIDSEEDIVLPVPTGAGKSYTAATTEWLDLSDVTDGAPVVMFSELTDARDDRVQDTRSADRNAGKLLGRHEACPVAHGDHDPLTDDEREEGDEPPEQVITVDGRPASVVIDELCDDRDVAFSAAHHYVAEHNDQGVSLPCCPPADESGARYECTASRQWNDVPRNNEGEPTHDIVHATHPFAHVPGLTRDSIVVFDEQPDFERELGQDRIRRMISALLDELDAPVKTFEAFVSLARMGYGGGRSDAAIEREQLANTIFDHEPNRKWYLNDSDAHTLAPAIARALWYALSDEDGPDANGRRCGRVPHNPPRLDAHAHSEHGWNREWVTVVVDEQNTIRRVRAAPDLSDAKCVIGLDARPTPSLWQLNTKPGITVDPILNPDERRLWRRYERGLRLVQVGDAVRPAGKNGKYAKRDPGREVFIEHLREQYGTEFETAITDSHSENQLRETMTEAGIDGADTMHFGEEKSRNDFAGEAVGAVLGCIDAGDDYVLDTLAELGLDAEPETNECEKCEGGGCPDDPNCEDGIRRSRGREFVGPDADTAETLVESVRENHVAQAAGRYARNADDPDDTALVFVRTTAMPTGYADYHVPGIERVAGEKQRLITEAARENPGATARELKAAIDERLPGEETVSKKHVAETLGDLHDRGVVRRRRGTGIFGADTWDASGVSDADACGEATLTPEEITNSGVWDTSTWEVAIDEAESCYAPPTTATGTSTPSPRTAQSDLRRFADDGPPN